MSRTDLAELRRVYAHSDRQAHVRYIMDALPAVIDELEAARKENATMRATIISAMVDVQHNLPGNGHAKLSLLLDGIMKAPRNNEERLLEEVRRLTQANGDLRAERDRAVKEAQRQDTLAKGAREQADNFAAHCETAVRKADAVTAELEAARAELEALKVPLAIYERHTKLIGAAEWLEEFAGDADGSIHITHAWLREQAAELRQEAEGK